MTAAVWASVVGFVVAVIVVEMVLRLRRETMAAIKLHQSQTKGSLERLWVEVSRVSNELDALRTFANGTEAKVVGVQIKYATTLDSCAMAVNAVNDGLGRSVSAARADIAALADYLDVRFIDTPAKRGVVEIKGDGAEVKP